MAILHSIPISEDATPSGLGDTRDVVDCASGKESPVPVRPADDPVLIRFRAALDALYGGRLERVVLFGSRARGDARADSDYDVAVFLKHRTDRWHELDRLADLSTDIIDE